MLESQKAWAMAGHHSLKPIVFGDQGNTSSNVVMAAMFATSCTQKAGHDLIRCTAAVQTGMQGPDDQVTTLQLTCGPDSLILTCHNFCCAFAGDHVVMQWWSRNDAVS